jgi:FkbM family methyltransferase
MLYSTCNDNILPSVFNDLSCLDEGPYEHKNVQIEEADIVLDLGANIGAFSCAAASKGAKVFAFEPTESTLPLLSQNAELYDDFNVVPMAVSDKSGEAKFLVNDFSSSDINIGSNTLANNNRKGFHKEVTVKTITVDDFVRERNLERVDFIKADIEGAERLMLAGATETLKRFAPKLAICTYHYPDDKEVLEELILKANPDYIVEHAWEKLYAHVPNRERYRGGLS